ncbi:hypothetical protein NB689_000357 [Xanthomonas sacchari]|nr:hypothetical protein [Xanthomonas sacchari]
MARAEAVASSTSAAFCWVAWSICATVVLTCSMPADCSREAAEISPMMSVTRCTEATISCMVVPAWPTRAEPSATRSTDSSISPLISLAALAERWASVRTSLATTAKPRPCSPARAASTAALSARMLVWKAMPSITPMMSPMRRDEDAMPSIVLTTWPTTLPPCTATAAAPAARRLACCAYSAFCLTVEVSSSIDAAVSSRLAACCSVRRDRSSLPAAISAAAASIAADECWMRPTISVRRATVALASSRIRANTPSNSPCMRPVRSPLATACSSEESALRLRSAVLIS